MVLVGKPLQKKKSGLTAGLFRIDCELVFYIVLLFAPTAFKHFDGVK